MLTYLIFLDVILSWLTLIWLKFRPKFLANIIDPLYSMVKKIIPTTIWILDLTPIVVIILIYFLSTLLLTLFPEVLPYLQNLEANFN